MNKLTKAITSIGEFREPKEIPEKKLFGYEDQMRAGLSVARLTAKGNFGSIFIFGYHGIGKKAFPLALTFKANKASNQNFSYLGIHCEKFLAEVRNATKANELLETIQDGIMNNAPIVVAVDELDYLSAENIRINPVLSTLHIWLSLLLRDKPTKVLLIGITELPHLVDKSIVAGFSVPLYFDITSRKTIVEIFKNFIKNDKSDKVANDLLKQLSYLQLSPVSAEIIRALSSIKDETFEQLSQEDIVKAIRINMIPTVSNEDVKKYRAENHELITLSNKYTIPYYSKLEIAD